MRVRITNNTQAPQGFYAVDLDGPGLPGSIDGHDAPVQLAVGQSLRLEINDKQLALAKLLPGLRFEALEDAPAPVETNPAVQDHADDGTRFRGDGDPDAALQPGPGRDNTGAAVEAAKTTETGDQFDAMDDDALRAYITDRDGKSPHHMLGRPKLLGMAREPQEAV